jgi:MFS family permease
MYTSDEPSIQEEYTAIEDTALEASQFTFKDLFATGPDRHLHRVILAYVNQMFQQISGINLITYYAAQIYEQYISLDAFTSRILAAANGTEYFLASWIAVFTIEKVGRRPLMLLGAAGMAVSMAVLAGTTNASGTATGVTAAAFLFIFNTFFAIG